jgi:hypothetical protein
MWLRTLFIALAVESRSGVVHAGGFGHLGDVLPHHDVPGLSGLTAAGIGVARAARRR